MLNPVYKQKLIHEQLYEITYRPNAIPPLRDIDTTYTFTGYYLDEYSNSYRDSENPDKVWKFAVEDPGTAKFKLNTIFHVQPRDIISCILIKESNFINAEDSNKLKILRDQLTMTTL